MLYFDPPLSRLVVVLNSNWCVVKPHVCILAKVTFMMQFPQTLARLLNMK